jgi:hypothetical protein
LLLKSGIERGDTTKEFVLADNERLIGFKSRNREEARHYDPVFIIGKLD